MNKRIYTNRFIQEEIVNIVKHFSQDELAKYCRADYSKTILDINFPFLIKVASNYEFKDLEKVGNDLLKYYELDTFAMVEIFKRLQAL